MTTLSNTATTTFNNDGATIQTVTVGTSGYYDITADGAEGGSGINGGGRVTAVISARSHQAVITTACLPALAGSPGAGFRAGHGGVSASPHITA